MNPFARTLIGFALLLNAGLASADRFAGIVEGGGEPTVTKGGYVVNNQRVAVQQELSKRPPTAAELGVELPPRSKLHLEQTARQIAQYHPVWRIYEYQIDLPRADFIEHFQKQGLRFDTSANHLKFAGSEDFIDGFSGPTMKTFRIWRRPR